MKKLLIIKTGTTFESIRRQHGDFENFIVDRIGIPIRDVIVAPVYITQTVPPLQDVSAVIITGSHAMVTDRDAWSRHLANWLTSVTSIPILGICYGHQLLGAAWGGSVDYHPRGQEVGTVDIELTEAGKQDPLLGCMPEQFLGHVMHSQTVTKLPPRARLLARNDFEAHHAFVLHDNIWGVQFHPEFNAAVVRAYIQEQQDEFSRKGWDVEQLQHSVKDHPFGQRLLRQFIRLAQ